MCRDPAQQDLMIPLKPSAEDYREAARRALENPWETPSDCQRRHDYYMAEADRIERDSRRAA